ncbi:thiol peroxidase [Canibacter zhoujuaniae]|uniref:thiol peroxidase n=1 Tax=Canibacter zhoujuaniae TaxID=2708343 RepID=UPI00141F9607|nr:thiol peroxidase [Canibacter zhoujuaniae]
MTEITHNGDPVNTVGALPEVGSTSPAFTLVDTDLGEKSLSDYAGKSVVLNIFPSIDTGVCATSVRKFNERAAGSDGVVVLCIAEDLPFAFARFCGAEGIDGVETLSSFRSDFGKSYGVTMQDGVLQGLLSRAVVVLNSDHEVVYTEQVPDLGQEPDYDAALAALQDS